MKQVRRSAHQERQAVNRWNRQHAIGTPVRYWRGGREGPGIESRTITGAQLLAGHTAVVFVDGYGSCVALTHVEPLEQPAAA